MNEIMVLIWTLAIVAGLLLGALFFGGLWWTMQNTVSSPRPALWWWGSLLLRLAIVLAGFHTIAGGHWQRLLACFLGFIIARFIVLRLTGQPVVARHATEPR